MTPWEKPRAHREATMTTSILDRFAADPVRFERFSLWSDEMLFDYSKTHLDETALSLLVELARETGLEAAREAMFSGGRINTTEDRAVLHTALRNRGGAPVFVDGADVMPGVEASLERTGNFAEAVRHGGFSPPAGGRYTDVVNIGIGGSDLGPMMACRALSPYCDGPNVHFVSNVDGAHLSDVLMRLDPRTTLIVVASKTFTTTETMTNARSARDWVVGTAGEEYVRTSFVAVSSAADKARDFGIDPDFVFGFEDWVGGRYSLWGPIGLPIMLAIGSDRFEAFLGGAHEMDRHFREAPLEANMPVLLGLIGIWHRNICGWPTRAVLPYDQRLEYLPAYLQQLDMESNGKSVGKDGEPLARASGPVVWGAPGTNGQHAFYQLLHQGTDIVPAEFMAAANGHEPELANHHDLLLANCFAQSEALMRGRSLEEARAMTGGDDSLAMQRSFPGNRPSTTLLYRKLDPATLGRIVALYEHRVFVEGVVWGINSFDQWGVELGKELATALLPEVEQTRSGEGGAGLLGALRRLRS